MMLKKSMKFVYAGILLLLGLATMLEAQIKVSCVGDSITYMKYPGPLQTMLGSGYAVSNFGDPGTTLQKFGDYSYWNSPLFPRSRNCLPDIVIIMLGSNDSKSQNWVNKTIFMNDYVSLVNSYVILSSHPKIYAVISPTVFGAGNYGINEPVMIGGVVPATIDAALKTNVQIIDMHGATQNLGFAFGDNVHPDAPAVSAMADVIYTSIFQPSGFVVTNLLTSPSKVQSNISQTLVFTMKAKQPSGTITNVLINFSDIGIPSIVKMTNISGATLWRCSATIPAGLTTGKKYIPVTAWSTLGYIYSAKGFYLNVVNALSVYNLMTTPSSIINHPDNVVVFSLNAKSSAGNMTNVSLDLSQVGGPSSVKMTNISGATSFRYAYTVLSGLAPGNKIIPIFARDDAGDQDIGNSLALNVIPALTVTNLATTPMAVTNDADHVVIFSLKALSKVGAVTNVSLNLTQLGGPATMKMTNISGATMFRYSATVGMGTSVGIKNFSVVVLDSAGDQNTGNNFQLTVGLPWYVLMSNYTVTPASFSNTATANRVVVFNVKARSTIGVITNVSLNLAPLGGSSSAKMTNISGATQWRFSYKVATGISGGLKSIFVTGKDSFGNVNLKSNAVTILAPPPPPTLVANTFQATPNPLFLSGSSQNTPLVIYYNAPKSGKVVFEIFSLTGSVVRTLQGNTAKKIIWNGLNDKGLTVASGFYFLIMKVDGTVKGKPMKIGVIK